MIQIYGIIISPAYFMTNEQVNILCNILTRMNLNDFSRKMINDLNLDTSNIVLRSKIEDINTIIYSFKINNIDD